MATTSNVAETSHPIIFSTQSPYPLPSQRFMIPNSWKRYQLSQLINKALSLPTPVPFDFLVRGELLRTTLGDWCSENGVGEEETLEVEYIESVMPPQRMSNMPHEDWVSSVSSQIPGFFLTASYNGRVCSFDYSQNLTSNTLLHSAPITSISLIPSHPDSGSDSDPDAHLLASASHDLTGLITRLTLSSSSQNKPKTLASLHLHTRPLSSITSNASGTHLLTSSWDGLIGLWNTDIPSKDEVPADESVDRKKRRKVDTDEIDRPKRKAPIAVLKSHTARVSKAVFSPDGRVAYSCGFDSTVRSWDVENGICTNTITSAERPMLDLALASDGHTAFAASTDRTISVFDMRLSASASVATPSTATLVHAATPSCIAPASDFPLQLVSGAYDGAVRVWDLRSVKGAISSFKVWPGGEKVLAVDWARGMVSVGGEGGLEIWKVGESKNVGPET